jgi:2-polyprenyl-3-methyl-5-hydroxy-6-metoxy-1,4-benzoquinol methylase
MARPYILGRVLDFGCSIGNLAELCSPDAYLGIDIYGKALKVAKERYPQFRFASEVSGSEKFDTIVALAVIEHVAHPGALLQQFKRMLEPAGRIVLTTPHPCVERIHEFGTRLGLLSAHANEEHKHLLDYKLMEELTRKAGLIIETYRHFLLGINQLFVLKQHNDSETTAESAA